MEHTASSMWEQLHNGLRAFIAKRVGNEAETEDLLQNIFLKVHQHADTLQEPERLVSWSFKSRAMPSWTITGQPSGDVKCQSDSRPKSIQIKRHRSSKRMKQKPNTSFRSVFGQ